MTRKILDKGTVEHRGKLVVQAMEAGFVLRPDENGAAAIHDGDEVISYVPKDVMLYLIETGAVGWESTP